MKRRTVQLARKNSNVFAQFDQKQISEFKEAFSFIDQNGDGVIDREDLKEVWASLGNLRNLNLFFKEHPLNLI